MIIACLLQLAHKGFVFQVSCNDWELNGELASAYLLERQTESMRRAGLEAWPVGDDPDSWVETPYAMLRPCSVTGPDDPRCNNTWKRPWADEMLVSLLTLPCEAYSGLCNMPGTECMLQGTNCACSHSSCISFRQLTTARASWLLCLFSGTHAASLRTQRLLVMTNLSCGSCCTGSGML